MDTLPVCSAGLFVELGNWPEQERELSTADMDKHPP